MSRHSPPTQADILSEATNHRSAPPKHYLRRSEYRSGARRFSNQNQHFTFLHTGRLGISIPRDESGLLGRSLKKIKCPWETAKQNGSGESDPGQLLAASVKDLSGRISDWRKSSSGSSGQDPIPGDIVARCCTEYSRARTPAKMKKI